MLPIPQPDEESDILDATTTYIVGASPGAADVWPETAIPARSATLENTELFASLQHAHTYYVTVLVENGAGTPRSFPVTPSPVTIDLTAPVVVTADPERERSPADALYWGSTTNLTVFIRASDPESGIGAVRAAIYEANDHPDAHIRHQGRLVMDWMELDTSLVAGDGSWVAVEPPVELTSGAAYLLSLQVLNGAKTIVASNSSVFLVDNTAPVCTVVGDGLGVVAQDRNFTNIMDMVAANWVCEDVETQLASSVWLATRTSPAVVAGGVSAELVSVRPAGDAAAVVTGLDVQHNWTVVAQVQAVNRARLATPWMLSSGILYDATPPVVGEAMTVDASGAGDPVLNIQFQHNVAALLVQLQGWSDPESGPVACSFTTWCTSDAGATRDVEGVRAPGDAACHDTSGGPLLSTLTVDSELQHKDVCYTHYVVENRASGTREASTSAVLIDITPPVVDDYQATPIYPPRNLSQLIADGASVDDVTIVASAASIVDPESGVDSLLLEVYNGALIAQEFRMLANETAENVTFTVTGLSLDAGFDVSVTLTSTNGARGKTISTVVFQVEALDLRTGVVFGTGFADLVAPPAFDTAASPHYGPSTSFTADNTSVVASWMGFTNPFSTVDIHFEAGVCVTGCPSDPDAFALNEQPVVQLQLAAGSSSAALFDELVLPQGATYAIIVNASDEFGNWASNVSTGVTVDITPPVFSDAAVTAVVPLPNASTASAAMVAAHSSAVWARGQLSHWPVRVQWQSVDDESSLATAHVRIGTAPRGSDVADAWLAGATRSYLVNASSHGQTVHATVYARNRAGLWAQQATSLPITIDDTVPQLRVEAAAQADNTLQALRTWQRVFVVNGTATVVPTAYMNNASNLGALWFANDAESTIAWQQWCLRGSLTGDCNWLPWTDLPSTTSRSVVALQHELNATAMASDAHVYAAVRVANGLGETTTAFSARIVVDTTPPQRSHQDGDAVTGSAFDSNGLDGATRSITATWQPIVDSQSGVAAFVWWALPAQAAAWSAAQLEALETLRQCSAVCVAEEVYTSPCLLACGEVAEVALGVTFIVAPREESAAALSSTVSDTGVVDGGSYVVGLVAINFACLWVSFDSAAFQYSTQLPQLYNDTRPNVGPMTGDFLPATHATANLAVVSNDSTVADWPWEVVPYRGGLSDPMDGTNPIAQLAWQGGDVTNEAITTGVAAAVNASSVAVGLQQGPRGERLILRARARNGAGGQSGVVGSQAFIVDNTPPTLGAVSVMGVGLDNAAVRATLGAALPTVSSKLDEEHRHGAVPASAFPVRSDSVVNVTWTAFVDPESLVVGYTVCWWVEPLPAGLGCCNHTVTDATSGNVTIIPGPEMEACECVEVNTTAPTCSNVSAAAAMPVFEATYVEAAPHLQVVTVSGINGAGLSSTTRRVESVVDSTPPLPGVVLDGPDGAVDAEYTLDQRCAAATFNCFVDYDAGILGYMFSIYVDDTPVVTDRWLGGVPRSLQACNLDIQAEALVVVEVTAVSWNGATASATSNGVRVLPSYPELPGPTAATMVWNDTQPTGSVLWPDGGGGTRVVSFTTSFQGVGMEWSEFGGMSAQYLSYAWTVCPAATIDAAGVELAPATCLLSFIDVGNQTFARAALTNMQPGVLYAGVVRATSAAGLSTLARTWNDVALDETPPVTSNVTHGVFPSNVTVQSNCSVLQAWWYPAVDEESGGSALYYDWSISTSGSGAPDVLNRTSLGYNVLAASFNGTLTNRTDGCTMEPWVTYYITLYVTNGAGLETSTTSIGVFVDPTPPVAGDVFAGYARAEQAYSPGLHGVDASWTAFVEAESELKVQDVFLTWHCLSRSLTCVLCLCLLCSTTSGL